MIHHATLRIKTRGKGTTDITDQVAEVVKTSGVRQGLVSVFLRHTSASLVIYENADPSARTDLHAFFERLVPDDSKGFTHTDEGPDDMTSHLRMVLTRTSEQIPVIEGELGLGTWQGIFVFEHRSQPHTREVVVTVIG